MRSKARLEVDLSLFDLNLREIRNLAPGAKVLLMVKAQAYGLGAKAIIQRAFHSNNISHFGFATLLEACSALDYIPADKEYNYFIFSETGLELGKPSTQSLEAYKEKHLIPVISNRDAFDFIIENIEFKEKPLVLKVDVGMNRFGFTRKDIGELASIIKKKRNGVINHLLTHFPCASSKKMLKLTKSQYKEFLDIKKSFNELGVVVQNSSVANSAAIERGIGVEENFIRPGLLAYGNYATREDYSSWKGSPIASLEVEPLKVFFAKKGTPVGYSGVLIKKDCWVAIVPLGYADGLTQSFSKTSFITQYGKAYFHGYMNMDISYLVFEDIEIDPERLNSETIVLIDNSAQQVNQLAKEIGISPYQIYCQLSLRVPRLYKIR